MISRMIFCKLGPRSLFSFLRQLTTRHCPHSHAAAASRLLLTAGRAAIDRYLLHDGPSAANPPQGQTDGRTGARQLRRRCCPWAVSEIYLTTFD